MIFIRHTRSWGKQLTYDIEAFRDGSYVIRLNEMVLRRGRRFQAFVKRDLADPRRRVAIGKRLECALHGHRHLGPLEVQVATG